MGSENAPNSAPNILTGPTNVCPSCDTSVDLDKQGISCFVCKSWFHAFNCKAEKYNISSKSSFNMLKHSVMNTGGFDKYYGKFLFVCDPCLTNHEKMNSLSTTDRVTELNDKIDNMQENFDAKMNDLKQIVSAIATAKPPRADGECGSRRPDPVKSVWDDKMSTNSLIHMMTIKNNDKPVDQNLLSDACINSNVGVLKTFTVNEKDTAILLKSTADAENLKSTLNTTAPEYEFESVKTKTPRITVVGLQQAYDKEKLASIIIQQNEHISSVMNGTIATDQDKLLKVLAVVPLRGNPDEFKAIIRVSNLIRSVISKNNNRLFIGLQSRCRVYDNVFVLRCYNCQQFGHHSTDCELSAICAYCAGVHRTDGCRRKADAGTTCCTNCKKTGKTDTRHYASSAECPILVEAQEKVKKATPFYRQQMLERAQTNH